MMRWSDDEEPVTLLRVAFLTVVFLFIIGGLFAAMFILDALRQAVPHV